MLCIMSQLGIQHQSYARIRFNYGSQAVSAPAWYSVVRTTSLQNEREKSDFWIAVTLIAISQKNGKVARLQEQDDIG